MRLPFLNRDRELRRLKRAIGTDFPVFIAIYGRRRCGKSRLLQQLVGPRDIYFVADKRESTLQIESLANETGRQIPGFDQAKDPIENHIESQKEYQKNKFEFSRKSIETVQKHWRFALDKWGYDPPGS